jgi:hypothetical protein
MVGETDDKDKNDSRKIVIALTTLFLIGLLGILFLLPEFTEIVSSGFAPGLGLRDSAVISFFITLVLMMVLAVTAGDGLVGEVQFMIGGFFAFFFIIWLLLAWLF